VTPVRDVSLRGSSALRRNAEDVQTPADAARGDVDDPPCRPRRVEVDERGHFVTCGQRVPGRHDQLEVLAGDLERVQPRAVDRGYERAGSAALSSPRSNRSKTACVPSCSNWSETWGKCAWNDAIR
jgi:hypothetical protein